MFRCQICGKTVPPKTKAHNIVTKREKTYPERYGANKGYAWKRGALRKSNRWRDRQSDPGGQGWEIAHEYKACPDCYRTHKGA